MMTLQNTDGYSQAQLDELNAEFDRRFEAGEWNDYGFDRDYAEEVFANEVSRQA
jgi:hypothetical protein